MIILEGPDGTGKTTLANYIKSKTNGMIIHAGYGKDWDIKGFHENMIEFAHKIEQNGCTAIIDRWAPSEFIYGMVFRGGPKYDARKLTLDVIKTYNPTLIYCRNDFVVQNHEKNKVDRQEMYNDISLVATMYDKLMEVDFFGKWKVYDFNQNNITDFVEELI
jgi:thymidylate kinase